MPHVALSLQHWEIECDVPTWVRSCRKKHPALYNIFLNGMDPDICRNVALYGYLKLCKEHDILGYALY